MGIPNLLDWQFFVCSDHKHTFQSRLINFNVDAFNIKLLYQLYSERFTKLAIVSYSPAPKLDFIKEIFHLYDEELKILKAKAKNI